MSPTEVTKRALAIPIKGIEAYLEFTMETGEDEGLEGWLPTLDTCLHMAEDNTVQYKFYEKPTCSSKTVQAKTAMNENSKIQIVSNDLVRRLMNIGKGTLRPNLQLQLELKSCLP